MPRAKVFQAKRTALANEISLRDGKSTEVETTEECGERIVLRSSERREPRNDQREEDQLGIAGDAATRRMNEQRYEAKPLPARAFL